MWSGSVLEACLDIFTQRSFYNAYWQTFDVVKANTEALREEAFRLRYLVYCVENEYNGFSCEKDGIEQDAFDERATHFLLIHKKNGDIAGTVRVLLPNEDAEIPGLPMQAACDHPLMEHIDEISRFCEISRLCMADRYRQRARDGAALPAYYGSGFHRTGLGHVSYTRRTIPFAPLGLIEAAFDTALSAGALNGIAAFDPKDFRALRHIGFDYHILGPRLENYADLQPTVFNIKSVLDKMAEKNKACWEIVSARGRLHSHANQLSSEAWYSDLSIHEKRDRSHAAFPDP